jgi:hypothetical protein
MGDGRFVAQAGIGEPVAGMGGVPPAECIVSYPTLRGTRAAESAALGASGLSAA